MQHVTSSRQTQRLEAPMRLGTVHRRTRDGLEIEMRQLRQRKRTSKQKSKRRGRRLIAMLTLRRTAQITLAVEA